MKDINKQKNSATTVEFLYSPGLTPYNQALSFMEQRVQGIIDGLEKELIWFLEHPPTYTAGRSAEMKDILDIGKTPLFHVARGGRVTYHGPGQLVGYVLLDLRNRKKDVRHFVATLEEWIIDSLRHFGINTERRPGRIGIWTMDPKTNPPQEKKIAALGLKLKKWVSYHGFAININPDLEAFQKIIPCGIQDYGVTSLASLGIGISITDLIDVMKEKAEPLLTL